MSGQVRSKTLEDFKVRFEKALESGKGFETAAKDCPDLLKSAFNERCKDAGIEQIVADTSKAREMLWQNINSYVTSVRVEKLSGLMCLFEEKLKNALSEPVKSLLDDASDETWPTIRRLLQLERTTTLVGFASILSSFNIDQTIVETLVTILDKYAINIVESMVREEAGKVLKNMNNRFETVFSYDFDLMPRRWTGKEDIKAITKMACLASLKLLSVLAAIRLDGENDNIEKTLQIALMDTLSSNSNRICSLDALIALTSNTWRDVPSTKTLITPFQCKSLWRQFKKKTDHIVKRAITAQEIYKRKNNLVPPPWVIMVMLILGLNELITILRNPLYLWIIFVAFLLGQGVLGQA